MSRTRVADHTAESRTSGGARVVAAMVGMVVLVSGLVAGSPVEPAAAIDGRDFQAGNIISDARFYDRGAMSEGEIQAFLEAQVGACQSNGCLSVLSARVSSRPRLVANNTGEVRCEAFEGGQGLRASTIVYRAQVACGISAKVLLVTLQKEQALVTSRAPSQAALDRAMGYACPDTAPCAKDTLGFGNQVYKAALQLNTYRASRFAGQPGTRTIQWHPNRSCGNSTFVIENYATAALYNYTPYRPNAAALANLGATGDQCSSYGNRNFWVFYTNWFGDTHGGGGPSVPAGLRPDARVERVDGRDRYAVSARLAAENYPTAPVGVVYVATGSDFPDALSAAAAAAQRRGPLLLVTPTGIPRSVRNELVRLNPAEIVVAGGAASVSDAVIADLNTLSASVRRDAGADRYEGSRALARGAFTTASTAYIATGATFPDALSASAAAAKADAPVILVPGANRTLDEETRRLLTDLGVARVTIAGGQASVSQGIEAGLTELLGAGMVTRHGGADRYIVSGEINRAAFGSATSVYVASGLTFPDALAGAAVAGAEGAPLYVTRPTCLPRFVLQHIIDSGASRMVILGGTGSVAAGVESWANC